MKTLTIIILGVLLSLTFINLSYAKDNYYDEDISMQQAQYNLVKDWWKDRAETDTEELREGVKDFYSNKLKQTREEYLING